MLDIATIMADDGLSAKFEAFHKAHGNKLQRLWIGTIASGLALPVAVALAIALLV